MTMTNQETYLTPEGFEKLEAELDHLKTVRRVEVASAIHEAKMDGDVSENAGYEEAKRQQAFLEGRIMTIEAMLKSAVLIESNGPSDTVVLGSQVTVVEDGWDPETYTIVGSAEADPGSGRISNESPLGKALMGQQAGIKVTYQSPGGQIEMEILSIE
jgi:transcription elongation factor GreA